MAGKTRERQRIAAGKRCIGERILKRVLEFVAEDTEGIDRGGFAPEDERAEGHRVKPVMLSGAQLGRRKISLRANEPEDFFWRPSVRASKIRQHAFE
jgi:hypothetical protein